jgi:Domain of unknown function (DUF4340)
MKLSGLLTAAVVLAALLGVLYWSNHHPATADSAVKASADVSPKILSLNSADIIRLVIDRKDEPSVDLSRNSSGAWQITAPKELAADQDTVSTLLSTAASLTADRLIADKASNLASYGLAAAPLEVDLTTKDNKTKKLLLGDQTPSGNAYYAMLSGDPRLYTVASYNKTSLDKSAGDLRDKRLLTGDFDKVSQIQLINQDPKKKADIILARNKDAWQILKPGPFRADSSQVDDLVRSLQDAKMETPSAADDAKDAAAFKSAAPFAAAKVTGASGTQELEIRKAKDDYYAKSSAVPGVYKVAATLATGLDKSLDDFRNKKLFDFGYGDVNKIEIHDESKSYSATNSGSDWWGPDGKKLDDAGVEALISNMRDLSADKFPDSGFTTPVLEITVTSDNSKKVDKVLIAKAKDAYIAKRENEPALYEVSSSAIQQLQQSAANLKPVALAPAKK